MHTVNAGAPAIHLANVSKRYDDHAALQPTDLESETRSGLILPVGVQEGESCRSGIITAAGPDVNGVEPGDKVLFPAGVGYEVRIAGASSSRCSLRASCSQSSGASVEPCSRFGACAF